MAPRIPRSFRLPIRRLPFRHHLGRGPIAIPKTRARDVTASSNDSLFWELVMLLLLIVLRLIWRMLDAIRDARAAETLEPVV